jgi:hypothetical protein
MENTINCNKEQTKFVAPKKVREKRKLYFRILKKLMRSRYKAPKFIYLGEEFGNGGIILSNHEGTDAPMSLEIHHDVPIRMWGASEMNSGLVSLYKYQTQVYYHEKKHWNIHLARLFCLIASPLTNLFYSGLNLISTYHDTRFVKTIRESIDAIKSGDNIVIYPEVSDNGYLPVLEGFHPGFVLLCEMCLKRGMDIPIYVTYFRRSDMVYIVDKPVYYSEIAGKLGSREEIAHYFCERCNALGHMTFEGVDEKAEDQTQAEHAKTKIS